MLLHLYWVSRIFLWNFLCTIYCFSKSSSKVSEFNPRCKFFLTCFLFFLRRAYLAAAVRAAPAGCCCGLWAVADQVNRQHQPSTAGSSSAPPPFFFSLAGCCNCNNSNPRWLSFARAGAGRKPHRDRCGVPHAYTHPHLHVHEGRGGLEFSWRPSRRGS